MAFPPLEWPDLHGSYKLDPPQWILTGHGGEVWQRGSGFTADGSDHCDKLAHARPGGSPVMFPEEAPDRWAGDSLVDYRCAGEPAVT